MSQAALILPTPVQPVDVTAPLARLMAGEVFVELCESEVERRASTLAALLARLTDAGFRPIWTGNPLRSPLTIERLILQAAGAEADLRLERSPAELALMLQAAAGDAERSLIIVQQPETLDAEARDTLSQMAPFLSENRPAVQFLFCGTAAFRPLRSTPLPPVETELPLLAPEEEVIPLPSARERIPLWLLLLVASVGAILPKPLIELPFEPPAPPALQAADAPHPPILPPSQPAPRTDVSVLRREFDTFLSHQSPNIAALPQSQRDALFEEFLRRHTPSATP